MHRTLCIITTLLCSTPAKAAPADASPPSIVSIESEGDRVTFTDSVGNEWCYQIDPWKLVWRRLSGASSPAHGSTKTEPPIIWTMKSETAVQALQRGVPPKVVSKLTGDAHPTPRELAEFKESGGVSHTALGGTPTVRSQYRRARSSYSSSSYPATRVGICLGDDPACLGVGLHLDFTGERVGFKVGFSDLALTSSLRVYAEDTRLYLHGEAFIIPFTLGFGGGIGWDIPMDNAQRLVLQPQIGVQTMRSPMFNPEVLPSGSISVNWGTPR